jgi:hypothetical protein
MKSPGMFLVVGASIILAAAGVLALVYHDADERRAIMLSAIVAFVTQMAAFAIARVMAKKNVIAGWGLGAILRFVMFGVWALVIAKSLGLPPTVAMISMAVFLFSSTLVEPLFLKT